MITWNSLFFHSPSSLIIEIVVIMHDYVMLFLLSVLLTVLIIILYRFFSLFFNFEFFENHQLERVWTAVPFILLAFIIFPSLTSLYMLDSCLLCGVTLNVMGHQWYWRYFYKDFLNYFDSYITTRDRIRLLEVDNRAVLPAFLPVRFLVSSSDVIHSWTIPTLGFKIDAIPGRVNQFCLSSKRSGVFFGQCSEICGANHSFIPIVVEFVNFKDFVKVF